MNYKKILIILLSIINIVLVLTLLIKPRIETFQEEQQQCLPFENTFPVGPTPTTIAGPQISDLMQYFCNTFVVIFLINDPEN